MKKILLTGGTGYIGSHICLELLQKDYQVVVVDNLSNSSSDVIDKIEKYTDSVIQFYQMDLSSPELEEVFIQHPDIEAVIHLAGHKSVKESVNNPIEYYNNNISGTLNLLKFMESYGTRKLIFSSSATVYGQPKKIPVTEEADTWAESPYGQTKLTIEHLLKNLTTVDYSWKIVALRYFNPIGAHFSRILSDEPKGVPENLVPYILKVAGGELPKLTIFGNDYNTKDGTAVRDYIHILDLVNGHLTALEYLKRVEGFEVFNLGTGKGYSVLDVVNCFNALGIKISYEFGDRRPGDVSAVYANVTKAKEVMGWEPLHVLGDMCRDAWLGYTARKKLDKNSVEPDGN